MLIEELGQELDMAHVFNTSLYLYVLQWIHVISKYMYLLKCSVNTHIYWFSQEIHVFTSKYVFPKI